MWYGYPYEITYEYFCVLGGLTHPRTYTMTHNNGSYYYTTYHLSPE